MYHADFEHFKRKSEENWTASDILEGFVTDTDISRWVNAAANRAYYAIFQAALYFLHRTRSEAYMRNLKLGESMGSHNIVLKELKQSHLLRQHEQEVKEFNKMKGLRRKADYEVEDVHAGLLKANKVQAKALQELLLTIHSSP